MIKCTFLRLSGTFTIFEIKGHAEYDKKGKDIICAAVSTVAQHTARALKKDGAQVQVKDGYLKVSNIPSNEISQRLVTELFETIKDLSRQYPRYINVEVSDDAH
ncbi:MAG: ribosomal-processing cysteine protease Prp [Fervidobacterium sp.]|jgi:uncharacterized protein YsxB (DUF464 family)